MRAPSGRIALSLFLLGTCGCEPAAPAVPPATPPVATAAATAAAEPPPSFEAVLASDPLATDPDAELPVASSAGKAPSPAPVAPPPSPAAARAECARVPKEVSLSLVAAYNPNSAMDPIATAEDNELAAAQLGKVSITLPRLAALRDHLQQQYSAFATALRKTDEEVRKGPDLANQIAMGGLLMTGPPALATNVGHVLRAMQSYCAKLPLPSPGDPGASPPPASP